jgi:hypothetical protein
MTINAFYLAALEVPEFDTKQVVKIAENATSLGVGGMSAPDN